MQKCQLIALEVMGSCEMTMCSNCSWNVEESFIAQKLQERKDYLAGRQTYRYFKK